MNSLQPRVLSAHQPGAPPSRAMKSKAHIPLSSPGGGAAQLGMTLFTYHGHFERVRAIAWSPDSQRLASAGSDHTVQVWEVTTSDNNLTFLCHSDSVRADAR